MYVDFEYANRRLSDFECIMCSINTDSGLREVDIGCDITFNTVKNNQSSLHKDTSSTYENVYTTTFDICKNTCGRDQEDMYMTPNEVRYLVKWLNRRNHYKLKLYKTISSAPIEIVYFGSFNVEEIMLGDNIIGLSLTFTANSPYGFSETVDYKFTTYNKDEKFYFYAESDEIGCLYPTISITFNETSDSFSIENLNTGTCVYIKNCIKGETITIDGENKIILSDKSHNGLYNDFNYEYLDVLITDEGFTKNEYIVSNPSTINISYMPVRKVGV